MTFPTLPPSGRSFSPGDYPNTPYSGWNGDQVRVRHSNAVTSSTVSLQYRGLTTAQLQQFIDHYAAAVGSFLPFNLPQEAWTGVADYTDYTLNSYQWRYSAAPVIEDLPYNAYNIEIELQSVVPQTVAAPKRYWSASATWAGGTAFGTAAGDGLALGVDWPVFIEWGEVEPDGTTIGQLLEVTATWTPGTALEASSVMTPILYTGNGSTQSITGAGFEPGIVWTKRRTTSTGSHAIYDYGRGDTKYWAIDSGSQVTNANSLTSFDADGFSLGNAAISNTNTADYVAWCLKKGAASSSNVNGSITTTTYVSTEGGFSIFTYTGTGVNATIGHGIGATPELVIIRSLSASVSTVAGGNFLATNDYLLLSSSQGPTSDSAYLQSYSSTTIGIGTNTLVNGNGNSYVGYAFKSVPGTSDIGTYTGTGAADQAITIGFEPRFVLIKAYSTTGDWMIFDDVRGVTKQLLTSTAIESTVDKVAFTSTGFTVKASQNTNTSSVDYVYLAFY